MTYESSEVSAAKTVAADIILMTADWDEDQIDSIGIADKIVNAFVAAGVYFPDGLEPEDYPYTV